MISDTHSVRTTLPDVLDFYCKRRMFSVTYYFIIASYHCIIAFGSDYRQISEMPSSVENID